jgi:transcriptional regulator with GAF, ATPase, and Fis domain
LRERDEDVELLARTFIDNACRRFGKPRLAITPDGLRRLRCYDWPGSVRELQNVIERAVILSRDNVAAFDQVLTVETLAGVRTKHEAA